MNELSLFEDQNKVKLLRDTYAKDLNDKQFEVFLQVSKAQGLNPFQRDIYGMVLGGRLVIITSIGGFRKIANRSGAYAGCEIEVQRDDDNKIVSATAKVKKIVQGQIAEFSSHVLLKEFAKAGNWKTMPQVMIRKVAEATALRMAFPEMQTLYEESELDVIRSNHRVNEETEKLTREILEEEPVLAPSFIELEEENDNE